MQIRTLLAGSALLALLAGCAAGPTGGPDGAAVEPDEERYQGTLPCRNCDGIQLNLRLDGVSSDDTSDDKFELGVEYINYPTEIEDETHTGDWEIFETEIDGNIEDIYHLKPVADPNSDRDQVDYMFMIVDESNSLELIDHMNLRRFGNGSELRLEKEI